MRTKILAWACLGTSVAFAVLALPAFLFWNALGALAPALVRFGVIPLAGIAILLGVTLLAYSAFQADS